MRRLSDEADLIIHNIKMILVYNDLPTTSNEFEKWLRKLQTVDVSHQASIIKAMIDLANSNWIIRSEIIAFLTICRNTLILLKR
jgi:hypothetical protein